MEDIQRWRGETREGAGRFREMIQAEAQILALHRIAKPESLELLRKLLAYRIPQDWV